MSHESKFSNCRDWRSFLSGMQCPPGYPSVVAALRAGHAWLTHHAWLDGHGPVSEHGLVSRRGPVSEHGPMSEQATKTYRWLVGGGGLSAGSRKTLGV